MNPPAGASRSAPKVDVLVCTFNSASTLFDCLRSAREFLPVRRLIVVDHHSTDATVKIAEQFGAEIHEEDRGLGYSRMLALSLATTEQVVFLDSDVTIVDPGFFLRASRKLQTGRIGAVVGMAMGHRFCYGLPFSLTVLPRKWAATVDVPVQINARETFYFQERLRRDHLRVAYNLDAMLHRSGFRAHKAEWEGANTRLAAGWDPRQLLYAFAVILLIHMNSRSPRNIMYTPIFYAKFLRGFLHPIEWRVLDRRFEPE
jgi:glycosyltransferase involved in cell wall biosynthesis